MGRDLEGRVEQDRPEPADDADQRRRGRPTCGGSSPTGRGAGHREGRRTADRAPITRTARARSAIARGPSRGRGGGVRSPRRATSSSIRRRYARIAVADCQPRLGQPRARRPSVVGIRGEREQAASLEPSEQATGRRQRDADASRDLADPRPVLCRPRRRGWRATAETSARNRSSPAPERESSAPTMPIAIRSRSSAIEATAGVFVGVSWPVIVRSRIDDYKPGGYHLRQRVPTG